MDEIRELTDALELALDRAESWIADQLYEGSEQERKERAEMAPARAVLEKYRAKLAGAS